MVEGLEETLNHSKNSGSDYVINPTLMEQDNEKSQSRQSTRERIPRRRFEIEFMIAPQMKKSLKMLTRLCLVLKLRNELKLWKRKWS